MVLIPVFWTHYTATVQGRGLKVVPCENCATEYVYVIEREASGAGTSMYMLNNEGAAGSAQSAAHDTLTSVLENDFDPVPCPACGHYQRHMVPKLLGNTGAWLRIVMLAAIFISCLVGVNALYSGITYLQRPNEDGLVKLVTAWSVLLLLCLTAFGLSAWHNVVVRRFDPNGGDPQARIAIGRSRAITREEFERGQPVIEPG